MSTATGAPAAATASPAAPAASAEGANSAASAPANAARTTGKYSHAQLDNDARELQLLITAVGAVAIGLAFVSVAVKPLLGAVVMLPAAYVANAMYQAYDDAKDILQTVHSIEQKDDITDSSEDIRDLTKVLKHMPTFVRVAAAFMGTLFGFAFTISYAALPALGMFVAIGTAIAGYAVASKYNINIRHFMLSDKAIARKTMAMVREDMMQRSKAPDSTTLPENVQAFDRAVKEAMRRAYNTTEA